MRMHHIAIQSVPRSGSSWLGEIFNSAPQVAYRYQPLFSYGHKDRLGPSSTRPDLLAFFDELLATIDSFVLQNDPVIHKDRADFEKFPKPTHLVMKHVRYNHLIQGWMEALPELRVIGLVRHPCAVLDSWMHTPKEFHPEWDFQDQWRSGALKNQGRPEDCYGFDKWKEVASLFIQLEAQFPEQFRVLRYADLNADPIVVMEELFSFCRLPYGPSTVAFITKSRSKAGNGAYSVFREARPDEAWKTRLPRNIAATVLGELADTPLARFL